LDWFTKNLGSIFWLNVNVNVHIIIQKLLKISLMSKKEN
jgi:hypothetical protein